MGEEPLEGYLVLRAPRYGGAPVSIVDWEARSATLKRELLQVALALGDFGSVQAWSFGQDAESLAILTELGFEADATDGVARLANTVLVKPLAARPGKSWTLDGRLLTDPANGQFRMIYADCC